MEKKVETSAQDICEFITKLDAYCKFACDKLAFLKLKKWFHREPPRRIYTADCKLCSVFASTGKCRLGQLCGEAHSKEELSEWKERVNWRFLKLLRAMESKLDGRCYTEQLLQRWFASPNPNQIMADHLEDVDMIMEPMGNLTVSEKNFHGEWTFYISSKPRLIRVALLYGAQEEFRISHVRAVSSTLKQKEFMLVPQCQEWVTDKDLDFDEDKYILKIDFFTAVYGSFRQTVVFDFGYKPIVAKHLVVDVLSQSSLKELMEAREAFTDRWITIDATIIPFAYGPYSYYNEEDDALLASYLPPIGNKFTITQTVMEPVLTCKNYRARQHELLYIEEMAQHELLSRYNVKAKLNLISSFLLTPSSTATAKYAHNGELFGFLQLSSILSEDSAEGRLILKNCSSVLLAPETKGEEKQKVYEAVIEDKTKARIYLRLSKRCTEELGLKENTEFQAEVQFQLNRLPLCADHLAVDRLHPPSIVFPDITSCPAYPTNLMSLRKLDPRINPKQSEAILTITAPLSVRLPVILISGPFGTGKTFTIAQAVKLIAKDPNSKILVCTHSNSAADIYIKDYFHNEVLEGHLQAPLRIYYRCRWVSTVHPTVKEYCLVSDAGSDQTFNMPTVEDVKKHQVIVTTLSTSRCLAQLGLEKGFFTHILIDEAAQAIECEVIMPLSLANENTRIVLAGDHMQLGPEVYSQFAQQRNLHISLLERLYDLYPADFPCKILLCENYRSNEAIIKYTSLLYGNQLQAASHQPRHNKFYPLTFFTAKGVDDQDCNSTAFHNNAEVYEIVQRVIELKKSWPSIWGEFDESSIGVVAPYYNQVMRIRNELRKRKLSGITVESVLNIQGKQFRAIFLSTVRTMQTCNPEKQTGEFDHGFLSNASLLNTAITRAQSLVAVVGDPLALCSLGKCRKLWENFIRTCHEENSFFGCTWDSLRYQLDSMELKKNFILNRLAPEIVPGPLAASISRTV